jgi:hypothetical protein
MLAGSVDVIGSGNYVSFFEAASKGVIKIPTYTKITPAIAARISLPYYPPALQAAQLERVVALMRSAGMVSGSFSVTPLLFHPGG